MKLIQEEWREIARWLNVRAIHLTAGIPADAAMIQEPKSPQHCWAGVSGRTPEECAQLDSAARAIATGQPLPELPPAQAGRLALRLRICARIARVMGHRPPNHVTGWFPSVLEQMNEPQFLEWLLVESWPFWLELTEEALIWCEQVRPEPRPQSPQSPPGFLPKEGSTPDSFPV